MIKFVIHEEDNLPLYIEGKYRHPQIQFTKIFLDIANPQRVMKDGTRPAAGETITTE
jgi:hypothetical protein